MPLRGSRTPHEGAGSLPVLLLDQGQLPCGTHAKALRRCEKGKPAVRRGRKAYGPALLKHREQVAGLPNGGGVCNHWPLRAPPFSTEKGVEHI